MSFHAGSEKEQSPVIITDSAARDDERRRLGRELHDTTSQLLVAVDLKLAQVRQLGVAGIESVLDEIEQLLREAHESIRLVGSGQRACDGDSDQARIHIAKLFLSLGKQDRPE